MNRNLNRDRTNKSVPRQKGRTGKSEGWHNAPGKEGRGNVARNEGSLAGKKKVIRLKTKPETASTKKVPFTRSKPMKAPATDEMRLNRFIANAGICSRREADKFIAAGLVTVNGKTVTELGVKVKMNDEIRFDGRKLNAEIGRAHV